LRLFGSPGFRRLLQVLVAFGLLALVIWRADPWKLGDEYEGIDVWPAIGAAALNVPLVLLLAVRGTFITRRLGYPVPLLAMLPISTLGSVAGSVTPAAAGDLLRTPFLRSRHEVSYADGVAAVLYERGYSVLVLALTTGAASAWAALDAMAATGVTIVCVAASIALPLTAGAILPIVTPESTRLSDSRVGAVVRGLLVSLAGVGRLLRDARGTLVVSSLSVAVFALMAAQLWLSADALALRLNLAEAWTIAGAAMLAGIISLLPIGLGTLDATIAALVALVEESFAAGAALAVLYRVTVTIPLGLAAVASYLYLIASQHRAAARPEPAL
jgi:uncharacterized protein (TIRG00374 family)